MKHDIIIYSNTCLTCRHHKRLNEVRNFCIKHRLKYQERRTTYNKKWRAEADEFLPVRQPFIAHGDKVIDFYGDLEALL